MTTSWMLPGVTKIPSEEKPAVYSGPWATPVAMIQPFGAVNTPHDDMGL